MARKPGRRRALGEDTGERVMRRPHGEGREALIRAVIRVVARSGLRGLTYRSVAKEAGVTHGLVHYHFGSNDNMLVETMRWVAEHAFADIGMLPDEAGDGDFEHFAEGVARLAQEDRDAHLFANEVVLAACRNPELHDAVAPIYEFVFETSLRTLKTAGVEPTPARARVLFAAINGLTVQNLFFRSPELARESAAELQSIVERLRQ